MKNKILLTVLIVGIMLVLLSIVNVNAENFIFKQNEKINYRFRCLDDNNNYCNNATIMIISIEHQNGNVLDNVSMSYNPTYFNVSLPTSMIGEYNSIIVSPTVNGTISEFKYIVNPTGYSNNLILFYIIMFVFPWGLFLLGLSKRDMTIAIFGTIGFYLVALYLLLYGINGTKDMLSNGLGIIHLGVAFYTSIRYTLESID